MAPEISIVTPSLRQLEWLRLCAASIADQEEVAVEHIIQDAGTGAELGRWAQTQPQLKLFVERDSGMYDAINKGLVKASGEVCAYLNCDEQYLPGTLRKVVHYFSRNPKVDVLFGDAVLIDEKGNPLSYRRTVLPSMAHLRLADLNTLTCATFFRRRVIAAGFLFPTHLKIAGDQYWTFQLLKAGRPMAVLAEPLSVFTFTGANLSRSAAAKTEKFGWLPAEERPRRWMTPLVVAWHRLGKLCAGGYRRRDLEIEIYTQDSPHRRRPIAKRSVPGTWPKV